MSYADTVDQKDLLKSLSQQLQNVDALASPADGLAASAGAAFVAPPAPAAIVVQVASADAVQPAPVADQSDPNVILVENLSRAWLRAVAPDALLISYAQQLADGTLTPDGLEMSFASSAMNSTIPALIMANVINGGSPPNLDELTAQAHQLYDGGNGLGLHQTYLAMSSQMILASPYAAEWSAETPTKFVTEMYQRIFGNPIGSDGLAWLVHDVGYYAAEFGSDLAGKGATIGGMLALKTQTNYSNGPNYIAAADAALHSAAYGGVGLDVFGKVAAWYDYGPDGPVQVANNPTLG